MIHFILTGGNLSWQYKRAIRTAAEVNGEVTLWCGTDKLPLLGDLQVIQKKITIPRWLKNKKYPGAYVYDYLALLVLHEHGGAVLGLDTISLLPCLDLLGDKELCVACDVPFEDYANQTRPIDHPFNNIMIAEKGSELVEDLFYEALYRLKSGQVWDGHKGRPLRWGDTGPGLLTKPVLDNPDRATWATFPALCGNEGSYIWQNYCGLQGFPENTHVVHLYSTAYPELYEGGPQAVENWVANHPGFEWVLPNKMPEMFRRPNDEV